MVSSQVISQNLDKLFLKFLKILADCRQEFVQKARQIRKVAEAG